MTNKKLYSATIFFYHLENKRPRKYRNISNKQKFALFAKNSGAIYINWYNQQTKNFIIREWLRNFS